MNFILNLFHTHDYKLPRWAYFASAQLEGKTTPIECECSCGKTQVKHITVEASV